MPRVNYAGHEPGGLVGKQCQCCTWRRNRGLEGHLCRLPSLVQDGGVVHQDRARSAIALRRSPRRGVLQRLAAPQLLGREDFDRWANVSQAAEAAEVGLSEQPLHTTRPAAPIHEVLRFPPLTDRPSNSRGSSAKAPNDLGEVWRAWSGEECSLWMKEVVQMPQFCLTARQNLSGRILSHLTSSALPSLGIRDQEAQQVVMRHVRELQQGQSSWQPPTRKSVSSAACASRPSLHRVATSKFAPGFIVPDTDHIACANAAHAATNRSLQFDKTQATPAEKGGWKGSDVRERINNLCSEQRPLPLKSPRSGKIDFLTRSKTALLNTADLVTTGEQPWLAAEPSRSMPNLEEGLCARCGNLQEKLIRNSECTHRLCTSCFKYGTNFEGLGDTQVLKAANSLTESPRCPICQRSWVSLHRPKGLTTVCIERVKRMAGRLSAEAISRLPAEVRSTMLQDGMSLATLGVAKVKAWLVNTTIDSLNLSGLFPDSIESLAPFIPGSITTLNLSSVLVNDKQLSFLISHFKESLRHLKCDIMPEQGPESQLEGTGLASLHDLKTVDLSYQRLVSPENLSSVVVSCSSRLTNVRVAGCILINDAAIQSLITCSLLEELDVSCTAVTEVGIEVVLVSCTLLRILQISDCLRLDCDHVLQACVISALNLEELGAAGTPGLTDTGLSDLLSSAVAPHFRALNFCRQAEITDRSVHLISRYCKALEVLELDMCNGVSLKILQSLAVGLPRLHHFPLRMIKDASVKSQLTYILRSRGSFHNGEAQCHEPEASALKLFLVQSTQAHEGANFEKLQAESATNFEEQLRNSVPNHRDPVVLKFYQGTRRKGRALPMWAKVSFAATKQLHKWLDHHIHDELDDQTLVSLNHLVCKRPSLGIFKGQTAMHQLLRNNVAELSELTKAVTLLVDHAANVDLAEQHDGLSPVLTACYHRFPDGVRALLESVIPPSERLIKRRTKPVLKFTMSATKTVLQQVRRGDVLHTLPEGTNVGARDRSGLQALHIAASSGNIVNVRTLITHKASPNALDVCGRTPLWWACRMGNLEVVNELLANPATNPSIPSFPVGGLPSSTPLLVAFLCKREEVATAVTEALHVRRWSELEAELLAVTEGLSGSSQKTCQKLLQYIFGNSASHKSWHEIATIDEEGRCVPPRVDRWQLSASIASDGNEEQLTRGNLVAEQLLIPLMQLGGDKQLKGSAKAVLEYLLDQGIASYRLDKLMQTAIQVSASLGRENEQLYNRLQLLPKLHEQFDGALVDSSDQLMNQGLLWGGLHQAFAHGPLPWLDKATESTAGALSALLDNGAFQSTEEAVEWVASLGSRHQLTLRFWGCVYDMWVMGEAKRVNPRAQKLLQQMVESLPIRGGVEIHPGPIKKLKRVQQKKVEYGSLADVYAVEMEAGTSPQEHLSFLHEVSAGLGTLQDRMAAGGMCDLVRATIECDDEEAVIEVCRCALAQRRGSGLELVRVKNGFHPSLPAASYRDIKLIFFCQGEDDSEKPFRHLIECQVLLKDFLALKSFMHAAYKVVRGEYGRVNSSRRSCRQEDI